MYSVHVYSTSLGQWYQQPYNRTLNCSPTNFLWKYFIFLMSSFLNRFSMVASAVVYTCVVYLFKAHFNLSVKISFSNITQNIVVKRQTFLYGFSPTIPALKSLFLESSHTWLQIWDLLNFISPTSLVNRSTNQQYLKSGQFLIAGQFYILLLKKHSQYFVTGQFCVTDHNKCWLTLRKFIILYWDSLYPPHFIFLVNKSDENLPFYIGIVYHLQK